MTKDELITIFKYSVLQHARKNNNITYACRTFNIFRTVYYKWLKRFIKLGYLGLIDKKKAKPQIPNRIKPDKNKDHSKLYNRVPYSWSKEDRQ